jgi:molybdate transport system ATP-binding protein
MFPEADPRLFAAVVYDDRVSIDTLLGTFAADLEAAGTKVGGVIQISEEPGCGPGSPLRLRDVATGEILPICETVEQRFCRLNSERFDRAASHIRAACATDAELIVVSRFGKMEARGEGFRDEITTAIRSGRRLLTAVRRGLVHNWFEVAGDVGTVLDARLWVLRNWWSEIAPRRNT